MPKPILRLTLVAFLLAASFVPYQPAVSAPPVQPPAPDGLIQALTSQAGGDLRLSYHRATGKVNFIGSNPASPAYLAPASAAAVDALGSAQQFLAAYGSLFGLTAPAQELTVKRDRTLDDGRASVRFQQVYQGLPVFGGELNVGLDAAKNVVSAGGEILPDIDVAVTPALDAVAAQAIAVAQTASRYGLPADSLTATAPELWIYNPALLRSEVRGATRLVWRMDVAPAGLSDIRELVLVDASSGKPLLAFNQIDTAMNRLTYTASNGTFLPGSLLCNQAQAACGDAHATGAHAHAAQTYDFFLNVHGRDSIDDAGMTLISTVHYGSNYFNAFWNSTQMVYGDAASFPLADDVVAHELTHGVTEHESGLFYYYQSGAINESFSDLWGEFLDQTNGTGTDTLGAKWQMGEDVQPGGAIRDMEDPTIHGDPDRIGSPNFYFGDGDYPDHDNGGVHINSGVNNKAVYLMTDGGFFNGFTVSPLGITKVAKIYYEVQTTMLTSASDYLDLYNALNQACQSLVGTVTTTGDCQEVLDATHAVDMNEEPAPGYNTDAPLCTAGNAIAVASFYDAMEVANPAWVFSADVGTNRWSRLTGYYATSGSTSLLGNDFPAATTDSSATLNPGIASLPANAFLHFQHAYGFEQAALLGYFDGGVLEYSINGGASWVDAGSLIQVNGYPGAIANSFGNPLGGRNGFVGDSHGYISTRVNLASLAGQAVRFRWRMGLDDSFADYGWFVDDVRIYVCRTDLTQKLYVPLATR